MYLKVIMIPSLLSESKLCVSIIYQTRCVPRWSVIPSFKFTSTVEGDFRVSISEFENTDITSNDLLYRYYIANSISGPALSSVEYCAR